jgi:spermidine synthase
MTTGGARRGSRRRPRVELLRDLDRPTGWVLLVDGVEQSYVDDVDGAHLEFEYMQHMAIVADAVHPAPRPLSAVHLGGGALSLPRWLNATRPGSRHCVVESSTEVLEVASQFVDIAACDIVVDDAVHALSAMSRSRADVVIWDLYDGPRAVTAALTVEVLTDMRRLLKPRGLALLNVSDAKPFEVVGPVLAGLRAVFDDVLLLAEPTTLRGRRSGNCVLAATLDVPLPVAAISRAAAGAPVRASVVAGADLAVVIGDAVPATTDSPLPLPDRSRGRAFL